MSIEEIKEKIAQLRLEWREESNNDILTYLNGQLTAWNDVLTFARKYHKERKEYCG